MHLLIAVKFTDNCKTEFRGRKRQLVPKVTAYNSLLTSSDSSETNTVAMKQWCSPILSIGIRPV